MARLDKKNKTIARKLTLDDLDHFEKDDSGNLFWKGKKVHTGWFHWQNWLPIIIAFCTFMTLLGANIDKIDANVDKLAIELEKLKAKGAHSSTVNTSTVQ